MSNNLNTNTEEKANSVKTSGRSNISRRQNGKTTGLTNFFERCTAEYSAQFPNEQLDAIEFEKKCTNRWKNMTKKEKACFETITSNKTHCVEAKDT